MPSSEELHGLLVLDKPSGITSRSAVDRSLSWFPRRTRIGHTGTLDPLATGVLVLCLGSATRLAEYVQRMAKTYRSTFILGATSDSDDADGLVTPQFPPGAELPPPETAQIQQALAAFVGTIEQIPPLYSAAKVAGRRAYTLARNQEQVDLRPRSVDIYAIHTLRYAYPELEVEVHCGKGTYIRSLARDLGVRLGCGAYVGALRRTRVGPFDVERALSLDKDTDPIGQAAQARQALLPSDDALVELPEIELADTVLERLRHGQAVPLSALSASLTLQGEIAVRDAQRRISAIAVWDAEQRLLRPTKVLKS